MPFSRFSPFVVVVVVVVVFFFFLGGGGGGVGGTDHFVVFGSHRYGFAHLAA